MFAIGLIVSLAASRTVYGSRRSFFLLSFFDTETKNSFLADRASAFGMSFNKIFLEDNALIMDPRTQKPIPFDYHRKVDPSLTSVI